MVGDVAERLDKVGVELVAKDSASGNIKKVEKSFLGLKSNADSLSGLLKGAFSAAAIKATYEVSKLGAKANDTEDAFKSMTAGLGVDSNKLLTDLKKVSGGTIKDVDLMKQSNQALMLMGGDIADKLPGMMEIARAAAKSTGKDVDMMFESLVSGMGRQSKMLLDNLGINIDVEKVNEKYALSLGKTVNQLTEAEKKQAFYNATLKAGQTIVKNAGTLTNNNADGYAKLETAMSNAGIATGKFLDSFVQPSLKGFTEVAQGLQTMTEKLKKYFDTASERSELKVIEDNISKQKEKIMKADSDNERRIAREMLLKLNEQRDAFNKRMVENDKKAQYELVQNKVNAGNVISEKTAEEIAKEQNLLRQQQANTLADTGSFFGSMAEIAAMGGEQTLGIYKGLAIAQTIVSSLAGAQAAMTTAMEFYGPAGAVLGPLMAAAQIAGGIARVAQISSTTTSSTSVSNTGGGSVSIPSAPTAINTASSNTAIEGRSGGTGAVLNINVTGAQFMSAGDFKTAINEIIQNAKSQGYDIQKLDTVGVVQ